MLGIKPTEGWVGIDAGASAVKLAQVSRRSGRLRVQRTALACRSAPLAPDEEPLRSSLQEIQTVLAIAGGTRRVAAGALSMSQCDLVAGRASLAGANPPLIGQPWRGAAGRGDDGWYTLATPEAVADRLCRDLSRAGLSCRSIDGMTHALARATELAAPAPDGVAIGAIDWSHSGAVLVICRDGRPAYVRRLRNCGLAEVEGLLAAELRIGRLGACELMAKAARQSDTAADLIADIAAPVAGRLATELIRTLEHLRSHREPIRPTQVLLFGGGALLGLHAELTDRTGTPVRPWTLPGAAPEIAWELPLFGPAIALSALAWEPR